MVTCCAAPAPPQLRPHPPAGSQEIRTKDLVFEYMFPAAVRAVSLMWARPLHPGQKSPGQPVIWSVVYVLAVCSCNWSKAARNAHTNTDAETGSVHPGAKRAVRRVGGVGLNADSSLRAGPADRVWSNPGMPGQISSVRVARRCAPVRSPLRLFRPRAYPVGQLFCGTCHIGICGGGSGGGGEADRRGVALTLWGGSDTFVDPLRGLADLEEGILRPYGRAEAGSPPEHRRAQVEGPEHRMITAGYMAITNMDDARALNHGPPSSPAAARFFGP